MGTVQERLSGSWTHSYEEDAGSEQIYRPDSYPFPPSRRPREKLDFGTGQVVTTIPGPDDRLQRSTASIISVGNNRFRIGDGREIEVVENGADMLKIRIS